jgi:hypothetical protein
MLIYINVETHAGPLLGAASKQNGLVQSSGSSLPQAFGWPNWPNVFGH